MQFTIPGKIPVKITPAFFIFATIIGFLNSGTVLGTLIWIGIILVSVLFHEMGHALTALLFGKTPRIELVALGGVTYHEGQKLSFWKQFFIIFNGPFFGFLIFLIAKGFLYFFSMPPGILKETISLTAKVNLFWTFLNLVPVMPLDGGQLLRVVMEAIFGLKGFRYALMGSMIISALISLGFFLIQGFLIGSLFFLLAYQSYEAWRASRNLSEPDRRDDLKVELEKAEADLQEGKKGDALIAFEDIRTKAKKGMFYITATQYVAFLKYELGESKTAYDLLRGMRKDLGPEALSLLHRAAFDEKDYPLVAELAGECYQIIPGFETALRNAYACAALAQSEPAVGWLQTAHKEGVENIQEIIGESVFDPIRKEPLFQDFLRSLENL